MFNKDKLILKKYNKRANQILGLEKSLEKLTNQKLKSKTEELKERLLKGESLDSILVEAFAVVREASWRVLHMKHYPVQLIGGMALHDGNIAEMKTGEGKTLVATAPVYLNALSGKGVHVVTVNDYLAKRDAEQMGKVYNFLGLSVGVVVAGMSSQEKKQAYDCDITYGTNKEFGFDYLRDNMARDLKSLVQRGFNYAIVDEVDSILIDEARTPLIISGSSQATSPEMYLRVDACAKSLKKGEAPENQTKMDEMMARFEQEDPKVIKKKKDYLVDEKDRTVYLTDAGIKKVEKFFNLENYGDTENMLIQHMLQNALKANNLMLKDKNYIIKDGEAIIVDEFTGRLMDGRRYSDGLHQAIEAKERIDIKNENVTYATITLQNYFRMYNKLSGMTGTGKTEEDEFKNIYDMRVICIPTNKPVIRIDNDDILFLTENGKFNAVVKKVKEIHEKGQPVLIGTASIDKSEKLSELFKKNNIPHNVLNAKNHQLEAEIIAQAGRKNAVTIATNMAGRGTDILLGGNPEVRAFHVFKNKYGNEIPDELFPYIFDYEETDNETVIKARSLYLDILKEEKSKTDMEHQEVVKLGGLFILGTEKHESRRIDNQLRGRSGRQGDPGMSQFYVSIEDDMLRNFGGDMIKKIGTKFDIDENEPIINKMFTKAITKSQQRLEAKNYESRKNTVEYDDVNNAQRTLIYNLRTDILNNADLTDRLDDMMMVASDNFIISHVDDVNNISFDELDKMSLTLKELFDYSIQFENNNYSAVKEYIYNNFGTLLKNKEKEAKDVCDTLQNIMNYVMLRVVDERWVQYISSLSALRDSVSLAGFGSQKPIEVYKQESLEMFNNLINEIKVYTIQKLLTMKIINPFKNLNTIDMGHIVINLDNDSSEQLKNENDENAMVA